MVGWSCDINAVPALIEIDLFPDFVNLQFTASPIELSTSSLLSYLTQSSSGHRTTSSESHNETQSSYRQRQQATSRRDHTPRNFQCKTRHGDPPGISVMEGQVWEPDPPAEQVAPDPAPSQSQPVHQPPRNDKRSFLVEDEPVGDPWEPSLPPEQPDLLLTEPLLAEYELDLTIFESSLDPVAAESPGLGREPLGIFENRMEELVEPLFEATPPHVEPPELELPRLDEEIGLENPFCEAFPDESLLPMMDVGEPVTPFGYDDSRAANEAQPGVDFDPIEIGTNLFGDESEDVFADPFDGPGTSPNNDSNPLFPELDDIGFDADWPDEEDLLGNW